MSQSHVRTGHQAKRVSDLRLWYAHKHGFVPDGDFDFLWNNCSIRLIDQESMKQSIIDMTMPVSSGIHHS